MVELAENEDRMKTSKLAEWDDKDQGDAKRAVPLREGKEGGGESTNCLIVHQKSCNYSVE